MFRRLLAPLVLVFIVSHSSLGHAEGFTPNERQAMTIMYNTVVDGLSKPGSTKLIWQLLVDGKPVSNEKLEAAKTDINMIRNAPDTLSYLSSLFSTKRGNCGEHATVLHAGPMFMKEYMSTTPLFSSVVQVGFSPGDHVFVVVASADREEIAILDTWAEIFMTFRAKSFEEFAQKPYFASSIWGSGANTPDNPYLKPQSMMVRSNNNDIWPTLQKVDNLRYTFLDVFPGILKQFLSQ